MTHIEELKHLEKLTSIVNLDQACQEILTGNLVAFPTETVFGLGANVENENAENNTEERTEV